MGALLAKRLRAGDAVLLSGPLGAGKTTFVRGVLEGLGHEGPIRSPTYNLMQEFSTDPPVLHADLYRVPNPDRLGIEEYLDDSIVLIEWGDRSLPFLASARVWEVSIAYEHEGRRIRITPPGA